MRRGDRGANTAVRLRRELGRRTRHAETLTGTGAQTAFTITHNLGSQDVLVGVYDYDTAPYTEMANGVDFTVNHTDQDGNTVTVNFTGAPALNALVRVVVLS